MQIQTTTELKKYYPDSIFGSLIIRNIPNKKRHEALEERKRNLAKVIREVDEVIDNDSMIQTYNTYFEIWGKTYPIEYQIKTIKTGKKFPQVSVLVDSMFIAELQNRILTSGHDLNEIQGNLIFDVSEGGEQYLKINGQEQKLKKNDVILKDNKGILASILYGPARRTSITQKTKDVLYLAWSPYMIIEKLIIEHLNGICDNISCVFESASFNTQLIRF